MLCKSCEKKKEVGKGIGKCVSPNCKNMTYVNYKICKDCSEKFNRCECCGKSLIK